NGCLGRSAGGRRSLAIDPQPYASSRTLVGLLHQRSHIERNAASTLRANAHPSHSREPCMRGRNERRRSLSRVASLASVTAISTYSWTELAIKSVRPTWVSRLAPTRPAWRSPSNVITGIPIQSASQVLVAPLYGNGSSAMSTRLY